MRLIDFVRSSGHRRALAPGVAVITVALLSCPEASAQTRERAIYATVLDAGQQPVTEVQPSDLIVREDGVTREILRITPATEPMQIALLVDNSQAASNEMLNIRQAIAAFVREMGGENEISFITLADRPTVFKEATTSVASLEKTANSLFSLPGSGTYLLDAVADTTRGFQKREAQRPVIVGVTIEGVEFSNRLAEQVIDGLKAAGAALYLEVLNVPGAAASTADEVRQRNILFDRGTRESGGRFDQVLTAMAFKERLLDLANLLKKQVKVVYAHPTTLIPAEKTTIEARPGSGLTARGTPARIGQRG